MDMLKKTLTGPFKIAITLTLLLFILMVTAAAASARDLPASTFLPFDNQQTYNIKVKAGEKAIYPMGSNYILMSTQEDVLTGETDIKAQQLDINGKELWSKVYEMKGMDTLKIMHMQSNGFVMAVNSREGSKNTLRLLQIGSNGAIVWQKDLPLKTINSIASTNDDGFIIAGTTGAEDQDIHLIKMDKDGVWQGTGRNAAKWQKTYSYSGDQQASQIIQLLDADDYNDGYILTGYTDHNTNGGKDIYVVRLNAYGEVKWAKNYGGAYDDEGITIVAAEDNDEKIIGFLIAGNKMTSKGDQNLSLMYIDKAGYLKSWPGYQRVIDGAKERQFGNSGEQMAVTLVPVPDGFKEDRMFRDEKIEGEGGAVLVGYAPEDNSALVIRINEYGKVLWQKNMPVPGHNLIMSTPVTGDDNSQDILYSASYPDEAGQKMIMSTLQAYLEGINEEDDKTIPQRDQLESNYERIQWVTATLSYEALRDISKELKDLLKKQPVVPLTAGSGRGEIEWPDTSYYLGNLVIGKADGEGTLVFTNGIWYKGAWKNNMFNGQGYLRFPTGENYTGDFKDHMMNGSGVMKWPSGEVYAGEFMNNMKHGKGIFKWTTGVEYEGDFAQDKAEGKGVIRWPNGERYEGDMAGGSATGRGAYYFPSGEWYEGEFSSLTFSGVGVYHWPDGACYVGQFANDRLNGEGYYIWPNGVQQWGYWKDDRYVGINAEALKTLGEW